MMSVKRFVMSSGERFAVLLDSDGFPMTYPNLYTIIHLRNRGQSINTISAILEDIKLLFQLLDQLGIDLEQRIKSKDFLKLNEIEAIANLASFNRSRLGGMASNKKIISFPKSNNKERSRAKLVFTQDYVSKQLIYRRLTNFAEYIGWLETYFHLSVITSTKRFLTSRRPQKSMDIQSEYKSFDSDQLHKILKAVDPDNPRRIWISDYITYRNEVIIYLFLYIGCRKGELLNLKITDITSPQDGTSYLTIRRNPHDGSDSRLYQPLVKTRSRSIAVNQNLKKKLETYILNYRSAIPNAELTDFLILSNKGQPLSINALDKIFSEISKVVLFNVHAHAFRHTWNDKFSEKSQILVATGKTTESQVENDRAYLMGWIPNSQSARRYSRRAENKRAIEVGLSIQEKFEDENE
ncbi:site-specific integrase [Acinetobacter baumannii]|uniref:site-specific integrase n=1 Tax=Acinetobacter baumannii TaxID=470 RepID=UPI00056DD8DC|nr:site-specific integrase [Acinetobacter baumannii]MDV7486087.1 site-specific integrase [Acinetobacter baumannii]MDV7531652.1 site-specific integrase [Acinetobacter baumannii]MDV7535008.1 site-specific integrase [Acinetobacter baumannii]QTM19919.1 site-specific integrase [Acinetobacter baumannii]RSF93084.1 site-specific integrase [Acinetobacter baumannii]